VPLKIERAAMGRGNRHSDGLRGEYLALSIIATGSKPRRSPISLMGLGALLVLGAGLIVMFGQ
jgi:hypothetical protein